MTRFNYFKPVIYTGSLLCLIASPVYSWGAEPVTEVVIHAQISDDQLKFHFEDKEEKNQKCPLYVKRMEYLEALNTLQVDLAPSQCALDVTGKRKGEMHWHLPSNLKAKGQLDLLVQGQLQGHADWDQSKGSAVSIQTK